MSNELGSGKLFVVATPIGNLEDLSIRAKRVLQEVDLIAAEDTRHSSRLLNHYGIRTPMLSMHEHNENERIDGLIQRIQSGQQIALVTDAGTPLVSDPGYRLVRATIEAGFAVLPVPGPSALLAALCVSGLATDRFAFEGFLPVRTAARKAKLEAVRDEPRTLIFYEAPRRLPDMLKDMADVMGPARQATVARELTKLHEQVYRGTLAELADRVIMDEEMRMGEVVVCVAGAPMSSSNQMQQSEEDRFLRCLLKELPLKQAVSIAAELIGGRRNELYQRALEIQNT